MGVIEAGADFESVKAIHAFRVHPLKAEFAGLWSIVLIAQWRLIVELTTEAKIVIIREVSNHYGD